VVISPRTPTSLGTNVSFEDVVQGGVWGDITNTTFEVGVSGAYRISINASMSVECEGSYAAVYMTTSSSISISSLRELYISCSEGQSNVSNTFVVPLVVGDVLSFWATSCKASSRKDNVVSNSSIIHYITDGSGRHPQQSWYTVAVTKV
jgi:hypothetical protein